MMPLPNASELITFFDTEPVLAFPTESWDYNHLTFTKTSGSERLVCELEPGELVFIVTFYENDTERLHLNLASADGLRIESVAGHPRMRVTFSDGIGEVIIQLEPHIHVLIETKMT